MAHFTVDRAMRTLQGKRRAVVGAATDGLGKAHELDARVAVLTVPAKGRFVDGGVAVDATSPPRWRRLQSGVVATSTADAAMARAQTHPRVIPAHSIEIVPARFGMAIAAAIAVASEMRILMTARAVRKRQTAISRWLTVTLCTLDFLVFSSKLKPRSIVVKTIQGHTIPATFVVAARAIGPEPLLVRIVVAAAARRVESQVGRGTAMAVVALVLRMGSTQRPAREAMVKPLLATTRPANLRRVPSQVFDVARLAPATIEITTVIATTLPNPCRQRLMAVQTFRPAHLPSTAMAFAAAIVAFKFGMGPRKRTWSQQTLSGRARRQSDPQQSDDSQPDQIHR